LTDELTIANERQLLNTLLVRVGERVATEQAIESQYAAEVSAEQAQYNNVFQLLTENYDAERTKLDADHESALSSCDERWQSESAVVQAEFQHVLTGIEERFEREMAAATKERDDSIWLVSSVLDDDTEGSPLQRLQQAQAAYSAAEVEVKTGLQALDAGYDQVVTYLQRSHLWAEPTEPPSTVPMSTVDAMKSVCLAAMEKSDPLRRRILGRFLPKLFRSVIPVLVFLMISGVLFGVIWGLVDPALIQLKIQPGERDWMYIAAGIAAALGLLPVFAMHLIAGRQVWPDYEELVQLRVDARQAFSVWERASKTELNMLEAECSHLQSMRVKRRESAMTGAENKFQTASAEAERTYLTASQQAKTTYPARLNLFVSHHQNDRGQFLQNYQAASEQLVFRRENDFRALQAAFDSRTEDSRRRYQQSWMELIHSWQEELRQAGQTCDQMWSTANSICPPWNTIVRSDRKDPITSPGLLSIGRIEADLEMIEGGVPANPRLKTDRHQFDLPALLPLHEHPSLLFKATGYGREAAVKAMQSTMLRYLTSLPSGKVRFTMIDPVGLGANFSAFMHLADVDELLVTNRIWTEPSQIEKRLADLTEHMETVLQTYLRNEFPSIDDYNDFAGEIAEPYRVVVVANFPVNFTDVAMRRLASIADGGRRCGVYLLVSIDKSQEIPRSFSLADLEKYATVVEWTEHGFRLDDQDLGVWPLALEQPPDAETFGSIVRLAGQRAREMRRIEVAFERVAPKPNQFWTSDSRTGIDIPIGRAGAIKLQHLRLGKGTSQHVLVAGKTGSGKSTLLHALITNLSLHYSPDEIEFYLIDFKKGVEFKVYAEQRLPHARVIAIESDREFGVSVLERLDAVLRERGELFREVGVQDIAGYRNARPDAVMPRALLLVDEFQEFFVEDDAMAQQASLLLDRLIRQGRAFGVHVMLGSQTLAGAYSLARSTLGQVAVRIALQCSDADAHLILSEENTAARLLTRPGEAIYNDANGLVEGNHPFQIVWLSEEERVGYLKSIRSATDGIADPQFATAPAVKNKFAPSVVFEGNTPADPMTNDRLVQALQPVTRSQSGTRRSLDHAWPCWLGDSVSLNGSLQLNFGLREGGNVLIVGRDESAALGIMSACALSFAGQTMASNDPQTVVRVLDGSLPTSHSADVWRQLAALECSRNDALSASSDERPKLIRTAQPRESAAVLTELIEELHRRADEPGPPIFLFVFDLARFRDLRKADDDYGYSNFGSGGDKAVSATQLFNELLRDGPSAGIFTVTWVESYQTAQRWLSRDHMNKFEQRIIFAMNSNDSASLIDSPLGGRLGENRAFLYRGDAGTLEKFRPFSPPPMSWLKSLCRGDSNAAASLSPSQIMPAHHQSAVAAVAPVQIVSPVVADVEVDPELPSLDDWTVQ